MKSSRWNGIGLAYPTDHNTTLEAIPWTRMATKKDGHTITILKSNHKTYNSNHPTPYYTLRPHTGMAKYYKLVEPSLINNIHTQPNKPHNEFTNPT